MALIFKTAQKSVWELNNSQTAIRRLSAGPGPQIFSPVRVHNELKIGHRLLFHLVDTDTYIHTSPLIDIKQT